MTSSRKCWAVLADTSAQRLHQCGTFLAGNALGKVCELFRVGLTANQRLQDRARPLLPSTFDKSNRVAMATWAAANQ